MEKLRLNTIEQAEILKLISDKIKHCSKGTFDEIKITRNDVKNLLEINQTVNKPTLYITAEAYVKMLELINQSSVEISWHGLVERDKENNTYLIYDILVFPQINSPTSTTTDDKAFADWQMELIKDMNFPIENLRMHGHSHVNMNVFSSGIDDKYQEDLIHKVEDGDYYIFLIMNKKMEICVFIYDFDQRVMFDKKDIKIEILGENGPIISWAKTNIDANCVTSRPTQKKDTVKKPYSTSFWDDEDSYIFNQYNQPIFGGKKRNGFK